MPPKFAGNSVAVSGTFSRRAGAIIGFYKMKILVINNLYPPHYVGGYELHCEQVTEGLRARGHEIQVLTSDFTSDRPDVPQPHVHRALRIHGMFGNPWLPI